MSFDINSSGPSRKPVIREAQTMENNGGGGNLGYMRSGKRKKKKEDEFEGDIQFFEDEVKDSFKKEIYDDDDIPEENKEDNKPSFFDRVKNFIKGENKDSD